MSWGEHHRIETPEQIDFNLEIAGPGSRFYAQFIDWMLKALVVLVLVLVTVVVASLNGSNVVPENFFLPDRHLLTALAAGALFVFFLGYDVYFEGCRNGRTPGKSSCGLRVVRDTGGPIDLRAAVIRNLLGLADFLPFFYIGGGVLCLLNARGQRLGDMAAGTIVIRERAASLQHALEPMGANHALDEFVFTSEQLGRCSANDQHVLRSFFARYEELAGEARRGLVERLRDSFLGKTGYQPATPIRELSRSVGFLGSLYRDLAAHRRQG